jgi:DNA-directed RNA polymerase specialized sigma24 family protein
MSDRELTSELFDELLEWLGPTRDEGAKKYEEIRSRLIRMLLKKGSPHPEELADEALNRVTLKVPELKKTYVGNPLWYFISVARFVWMESVNPKEVPFEDVPDPVIQPELNLARECLQQCLKLLAEDQRDLLLDYHVNNKKAKIDLHRRMAEELDLSANALRLRVHRLRVGLEKCVLTCLNGVTK